MSLDAQILAAFRAADDGFVTSADLSHRLDVSRATVGRHI